MVWSGYAISNLAAPTFAITLLAIIKLTGIIAIDFITLLFALLSLLTVKFPEVSTRTDQTIGSRFTCGFGVNLSTSIINLNFLWWTSFFY